MRGGAGEGGGSGGGAAEGGDPADGYKVLTLGDGSEIAARVVLVATGVSYRRLSVPGIEPLEGRGVYYGAGTTEAASCRDRMAPLSIGSPSEFLCSCLTSSLVIRACLPTIRRCTM